MRNLYTIIMTISIAVSFLFAIELSLDNEHSGQRRDGSQLWDIVFDVDGLDDTDSLKVELQIYTQSGEELNSATLSGDYPFVYGSGEKRIIWDIGADEPGREFYSDSILIKLTLEEPGTNPGRCNVDIVIVFDTTTADTSTGSIFYVLPDAQANIDLFTDSLESIGLDYQLGLVTFGTATNFPDGYDMTMDRDEFHDWMWALNVDWYWGAEVALDAVADAINSYHWRPDALHILLLVTDSDFHEEDDGSGLSDETPDGVLTLLNDSETICFVVSPDTTGWGGISTYCYDWYLNFASASGGNWYLLGTPFNSIYFDIATIISEH